MYLNVKFENSINHNNINQLKLNVIFIYYIIIYDIILYSTKCDHDNKITNAGIQDHTSKYNRNRFCEHVQSKYI